MGQLKQEGTKAEWKGVDPICTSPELSSCATADAPVQSQITSYAPLRLLIYRTIIMTSSPSLLPLFTASNSHASRNELC